MEAVQQDLIWNPANMSTLKLSVQPPLLPESEALEEVFEPTTIPEFGSFEVRIPIPEDAEFKDYLIYVQHDGEYVGYAEHFTVGDPRPPTVELTLDAPYWVCTSMQSPFLTASHRHKEVEVVHAQP